MLGSLARKLRAFGFDTAYFREGDDASLISIAASEGRVMLTSDRSLAERARGNKVPTLLVTGNNDSERISSLAKGAKAGGLVLVSASPLCSICNGTLIALAKREVAGEVPPSVLRRHRLFYRCEDCGQYYWRGAHWKKLRWLERRLGEKPNATVS
jgi:uncharacterized protein with PIN domain